MKVLSKCSGLKRDEEKWIRVQFQSLGVPSVIRCPQQWHECSWCSKHSTSSSLHATHPPTSSQKYNWTRKPSSSAVLLGWNLQSRAKLLVGLWTLFGGKTLFFFFFFFFLFSFFFFLFLFPRTSTSGWWCGGESGCGGFSFRGVGKNLLTQVRRVPYTYRDTGSKHSLEFIILSCDKDHVIEQKGKKNVVLAWNDKYIVESRSLQQLGSII